MTLCQSTGEGSPARRSAGANDEDLGQPEVLLDLRQLRPRRHHRAHALRRQAGQGLVQCE